MAKPKYILINKNTGKEVGTATEDQYQGTIKGGKNGKPSRTGAYSNIEFREVKEAPEPKGVKKADSK
jgi:hypothetical protein